MLKFVLITVDDIQISVDNIINYELTRGIDAPCDGLRLRIYSDTLVDEIACIKAYYNNKIVFNGYVDTQRQEVNSQGYNAFFYARSSACILIDIEAEPITYNCPSSSVLWYKNAYNLGFTNDLPNVAINDYYEVQKGTSCYGVINNFIKALTGNGIYVDSDNKIKLLKSNDSLIIDKNDVLSEKKNINRGLCTSLIDYKSHSDTTYNHHLKSKYLQKKGILKNKKLNTQSLPNWQRHKSIENKFTTSIENYYTCEFLLSGIKKAQLCDKIIYNSEKLGDYNNYLISSITYKKDKNGITTKICAYKNIDLEVISYVAE